jgi:hypothetical protein
MRRPTTQDAGRGTTAAYARSRFEAGRLTVQEWSL